MPRLSSIRMHGVTWQLLILCGFLSFTSAAERGESVVVVYNKAMPESKAVADHYAKQRGVPEAQVFGFNLSSEEAINRDDFENNLQKPLWEELTKRKLLNYSTNVKLGQKLEKVEIADSKVRYIVLCYGVPVKIQRDSTRKEEGAEKLPAELQRNEAAVDTELALLPRLPLNLLLAGPYQNPAYGTTNTAAIHPTNGFLIVARLDGPNLEVAKGLVDKALQAEKDGLWGRAYFDSRGLTNGGYQLGDEWMRGAAEIARKYGFETQLDTNSATLPPSFPMSHTAIYMGWYEQNIIGPYLAGMAEFMPGTIAYHLHSYSAQVLRTTDRGWAGPLLWRGAAATIGFTEEPYLQFTIDLPTFLSRLTFLGFSFGEAAYSAQQFLSWQTTVIGDPLYTPFGKSEKERFEELSAAKNPLIEWSHLLVVNRNLGLNTPLEEVAKYIQATPETRASAVLQEKLGDLYKSKGKIFDSIEAYLRALASNPSALQRTRITLVVGNFLSSFGRAEEAYDLYKQLLAKVPQYPDKPAIYEKLAKLADSLNKKEEAAEYRKLAGDPPKS